MEDFFETTEDTEKHRGIRFFVDRINRIYRIVFLLSVFSVSSVVKENR